MIRRKNNSKNIKFNKGNRNKQCYRGLRGCLCPTSVERVSLCRVAKQNKTAVQNKTETESNQRSNVSVTIVILHESHLSIYIYTYKLNNFYTYKVHRCASFFKFQFPFISVYPYYHICVTKIDNGMILNSPPVSANFTQIVNNPPSS